MALLPSRTKYRKAHKGRIYGTAQTCNTLAFGDFGIQSLTRGRMTSQQIEAARVAMTRSLKRKGKVWIRVFRINLSPKSLQKLGWVKEKVPLSAGLL